MQSTEVAGELREVTSVSMSLKIANQVDNHKIRLISLNKEQLSLPSLIIEDHRLDRV